MSYTETEDYQREIAEQYQKRNLKLALERVHSILCDLGFMVAPEDIEEADAGNMNATFLTTDYVVKVSADRDIKRYLANKIVSEALPDAKVVRTLVHDHFNVSDYEVLVMEKAAGISWLKVMPEVSAEQNKRLFSEVLEVCIACRSIRLPNEFGWVSDILSGTEKTNFTTYGARLESRLVTYISKIRQMEYIDQTVVSRIVAYVEKYLDLFMDDEASFVHSDLHMGNVMQADGNLTAVIDWDSTHPVPSYVGLIPLIGLIDNPAQFVEGTPHYTKYKGKKFEYLYPLLKDAYAEELKDPALVRKLNVLGIIENLMWVSGDWSKEWNKEAIYNLITNEVVKSEDELKNTYFGGTIRKIVEGQ